MKTVAILQSNYIPWKGYFDIIAKADVFVIYDEVQYTKNDWRNRNKIITAQGPQWLTIPVKHNSLEQRIFETMISDPKWTKKHVGTLQANYAKAANFASARDMLFPLYESASQNLSEVNVSFIKAICAYLGITTEIVDSRDLALTGDKVDRLIDACTKLGATNYLSGPAAKDYIDESRFAAANLTVEWMDYSGYPEYTQLQTPFEHGVSIVDLLFNEGEQAKQYLKYAQ